MRLKIITITLLFCSLLTACNTYEREYEPLEAVTTYTEIKESKYQEFTIADYDFIKTNKVENSVLKVKNADGGYFYMIMASELANTLYDYSDKIKIKCIEEYPDNWIELSIGYYEQVYDIDNKEEILSRMIDSGINENNILILRDYSIIDNDGKDWGHLSIDEINTLFNN